jgi:EmrB/QacA subfamily drug resistance transporter
VGLRDAAEWNPISAVVAAVRELFGNPTAVPHDAPWPLQAGRPSAGTNALDRNVRGKTVMNTKPWAASGERAITPSSVPVQIIAPANPTRSARPPSASSGLLPMLPAHRESGRSTRRELPRERWISGSHRIYMYVNPISTETGRHATTGWVIALTGIGSLMAALDTLVVSTALSTIRLDLGASVEELEWTVNAYNLSFAVSLIAAAALGDRYGRRRLYAAGLTLFALASAACALAPNVGWLIGARAVQGMGAALLLTLGLALLSAAFPPERRGAAIGIFSAVTGISVAAGPLVGGAVVEGIDWEWIFGLNVPIGLAAVPLVLSRLDESFGPDTGLDLPGLALITGGAFGIVWGLVRGNAAGWASPEVVGTLALGLLLVAAFVAWELRAREPMLPMAFFRSRAFSGGNAAIFFTFASLFTGVFFFAQLLQTALGYGPLDTGLRLLPWTATFITVAPVVGALTDRIGERPFMVGGLVLQAAGLTWIALIAGADMAYGELVPPLIVAGIGVSMAIPSAQNSVVGAVPLEGVGKAAGANSMMRELGGVFGIAVAVAVFAGAGSYASAQAFTDGFAPAIGVAATLSLAGALAGLALPGRGRPASVALAPGVAALEGEQGGT